MKKVLSWIFAMLSIVLLIVFVVFLILYVKKVNSAISDMYTPLFMMGIMGAIVTGTAGHLFAYKDKGFPYYVTFPTFGIVFVFFGIIRGVKYLFNKLLGRADDFPSSSEEDTPVYIVIENGYERRLTLFEEYKTDYSAPLNAGYGRTYNLFRDDTGRFWRSYDGNKTFIRE